MKFNDIVLVSSMAAFLFIGWIMLDMPTVKEHKYVPVEHSTVIVDPVILNMNELEFVEAFYIMRVAKGTYADFYWNNTLYNTCYEEEATIAPDRCKGVLTYLNQGRIEAWQRSKKED